jgi:hypothetical protein
MRRLLWNDINIRDMSRGVGRAIAQADSRRLLTAAARVRAQVTSCGICGGQNDTKKKHYVWREMKMQVKHA